MIKLGITGGIGSGKSYVSCLLRQLGIEVYDTDSESKRITLVHPQIRKELINLLGEEVYKNGAINKSLLAGYLFSGKDNAVRINAIIHPRVQEDFLLWADRHVISGAEIIGLESAILFESGFNHLVDVVLMVDAPLDVRIRRVMERDHVSESQVMERIAAQMADDEKRKLADFVIMNDGTQPLLSSLKKILQTLRILKATE